MRRWFFNILAALSLAIAIVAAGHWLCQYASRPSVAMSLKKRAEPSSIKNLVWRRLPPPPQSRFDRALAASSPDLLVAITAIILPARWLASRIRRKQQPTPGLCLICGYDLRASEERCPECGTSIPAKALT